MTVRIPVAADISGALHAFRVIQDAMRRAGMEAKAFADVNLGHPELKTMAEDLRRVQERAMDLARLGRGSTATAWRAVGGAAAAQHPGDLLAAMERLGARYPDGSEAARMQARAADFMLRGTRWQLPPTLPPSSPPGGWPPAPPAGRPGFGARPSLDGSGSGGQSGGGGRNGAGGSSALIGGMGRFVGGMLGGGGLVGTVLRLAGIQAVGSMVASGVHSAEDESVQNARTMRHLGDLEPDFFKLRDSMRAMGDTLGITRHEGQELAQVFARASWATDTRAVQQGITYGARFARGFGLDNGYAVQAFGHADRNMIDPKQFGAVVADAVQSGNMGGKTEEVMDALLRWSDTASRQMVVGNSRYKDFAAMYSGMNNMGMPGLRGQNAESTIAQMNAALSQGGGFGLASQYFTARAFARHGVTDPYRQAYIQEGGMFARMSDAGGRDNTTVFDAHMEQFRQQYGGMLGQNNPQRFQAYDAFANHMGLTPRQAEQFLENYKPGQIGQTEDKLRDLGLSLHDVRPDALGDIGRVLNGGDLGAMRAKLLERNRLGEVSNEDAAKLRGADPDKLQGVIIQLLAKYGSEKQQGDRVLESQNRLSNSLNDLGSHLVTPLNELRDGTAKLLTGVNNLTEVFALGLRNLGLPHLPEATADGIVRGGAVQDRDWDPINNRRHTAFSAWLANMDVGGINRRAYDGMRAIPGEAAGSRFARGFGSGGAAVNREAAARESYDFWIGKGFTPAGAAAMVAQEQHESGFDPNARGDGGAGHGLYQWHPERRAAIQRATGIDVSRATAAQQREAMYQEMFLGLDAQAGAAFAPLKNAGDARRAGGLASSQVERPRDRDQNIMERGRTAEDWERRFRSRQAQPGGPAPVVRLGRSEPGEAAPEEPDLTRGGRLPSEPMFPAPDNEVGRDAYNRATDALRRGAGSTPGDGIAPPPLEMQTPSPGTIPGATPVPDDGGSAMPRQEASLSFAPLRVVHETPTGQILREEVLPPTVLRRPMPLGIG